MATLPYHTKRFHFLQLRISGNGYSNHKNHNGISCIFCTGIS